MSQLALVTDFDGTISDDDFFWYVAERYLDKSAMQPWESYLRGEISHLEALNRIFACIRLPEQELLHFIDTIRIDPDFPRVAEYCFQKDIPVYIDSAGCDYYISRLIGRLIEKYNLQLVTNHGVYSPDCGLKMIPPVQSIFYDPETGISKAAVVKYLRERGCKVILAGDGLPDFPPAQIADVVFAKKTLQDECRAAGIKTEPFSGFADILNYLQEA